MEKYMAVPASDGLAFGPVCRVRRSMSGMGRAVLNPREEEAAYRSALARAQQNLDQPVSYTHLDVYKRQGIRRRSLRAQCPAPVCRPAHPGGWRRWNRGGSPGCRPPLPAETRTVPPGRRGRPLRPPGGRSAPSCWRSKAARRSAPHPCSPDAGGEPVLSLIHI